LRPAFGLCLVKHLSSSSEFFYFSGSVEYSAAVRWSSKMVVQLLEDEDEDELAPASAVVSRRNCGVCARQLLCNPYLLHNNMHYLCHSIVRLQRELQ